MKKKLLSLMLACAILMTTLVVLSGITSAAASAEKVFEYDFDNTTWDALSETGLWVVETTDNGSWNCKAPTVENGAMKLGCAASDTNPTGIHFLWEKTLDKEAYGTDIPYTFEFDVNITDWGDGTVHGSNSSWHRALYVSLGGWYNQIAIYTPDVADSQVGNNSKYNFSEDMNQFHVKVVIMGDAVTTTLYDAMGNVLKDAEGKELTSTRTNSAYANPSDSNVKEFSFRVEDGVCEIDNFTFTNPTTKSEYLGGGAEAAPVEKTFEYNFDNTAWNDLVDTGLWAVETKENGYWDCKAPAIENGAMKFTSDSSSTDPIGVHFLWEKTLDKNAYSSDISYTFDFDVKVTDWGDGTVRGANDNWHRVLYVAMGGYYNQIAIYKTDAASTQVGGTSSYTFSENMDEFHVKVVIKGDTITTTLFDTTGNVMKDATGKELSSSRTNSVYATPSDSNAKEFSIRVEDGACEIDNFTFTNPTTKEEYQGEDKTKVYEYDFSNAGWDDLADSGLWVIETKGNGYWDCKAPTVANGVMKFECLPTDTAPAGVHFLWEKTLDKNAYSVDIPYTFEFDVKITDWGDGTVHGANNNWHRVLYVAMGGYYNQIAIYKTDAASTQVGGTSSYTFSENMDEFHVKVVIKGDTITTTLFDTTGNVMKDATGKELSSSRTNSVYATPSDSNAKEFSIRVEDGACEIDNFTFTNPTAKEVTFEQTDIKIDEGKQAKYTNVIKYAEGETVTATLGDNEIFSISAAGMKICGSSVLGTYPTGDYGLCAYINPAQDIMYVEVTLPDGGIVRRGIATAFADGKLRIESDDMKNVGKGTVEYTDVSVNEYELVSVEPASSAFGGKVYNIISSFDDASTTRYFAWTAKESYIGTAKMAIKYRVAGTTEWKTVEARRQTEATIVSPENYYKVEINGLNANTEYEYKIGKMDSKDETNDWSETYAFTTAPRNIEDFSFVVIGDNQSTTWGGDHGYKYTEAAVKEAMEEVKKPAFIMNTGDVSESGSSITQWNWYFKTLGKYAYSIPHFATIGNHDTWTDNSNNYFGFHFNHPDNGANAIDKNEVTGLANGSAVSMMNNYEDTIYSYNYGDAHFIVFNSGVYDPAADAKIQKAQREWLENDLKANSDAKWTVILTHEPLYHRLSGSNDRLHLNDLIEKYGVDLVILGHSHLVTRTYPMKDGAIVTKVNPDTIVKGTGTVYATVGSTTTSHDTMGNPNAEECMLIIAPANAQPTYTVVSVEDNKLTMTIKQVNGYVLDTFTIVDECEHTGGTATCKDKAVCDLCGKVYGDLDDDNHAGDATSASDNGDGTHDVVYDCCKAVVEDGVACSGGTATCKDKAICSVCGGKYGELDADDHAGDATLATDNGDGTHDIVYDCCDAVVEEDVAHDFAEGDCACGAKKPSSPATGDGLTAMIITAVLAGLGTAFGVISKKKRHNS